MLKPRQKLFPEGVYARVGLAGKEAAQGLVRVLGIGCERKRGLSVFVRLMSQLPSERRASLFVSFSRASSFACKTFLPTFFLLPDDGQCQIHLSPKDGSFLWLPSVKSKADNKRGQDLVVVLANILLVLLPTLHIGGVARVKEVDRIEEVSRTFLEKWLVKKEVGSALDFIAAQPVMGACLVDKGEDLSWRKSRKRVIDKLRPVFEKLAGNPDDKESLENIIASQEKKLEYSRIDHNRANLFDLYPVTPTLLKVILNNICSGKDKTAFFQKGIRSQSELYLMLFHFKEGLKVTVLWAREGDKLRIVSIDFPD